MDLPYPAGNQAVSAPGDSASPRTIQALAATKPWVRFASVMGFLGAISMVVYGVMAVFFAFIPGQQPGGPNLAAMTTSLGIFYLALSVVYAIPSLKLWKFASAIARLQSSQSSGDLEHAIHQQRGFWKAAGILFIVTFILGVVMFIAIMAVTLSSLPTPR